MGERLAQPPLVFRVNWFRTDESGQFLWPGFGENLRVLRWVLGRVHGEIGLLRRPLVISRILPTLTSRAYVTPAALQGIVCRGS